MNLTGKIFALRKTAVGEFMAGKKRGPTEIRTRIVGFKVQSDSHYTIRPDVQNLK